MANAPPFNAGIIAPAPLLYGGAFVLGLVVGWLRPELILSPSTFPIGFLVLAVGGVLAIGSKRTLERAGTSANPSLPATALVTTGPFRFSRNPLYLARTLLYLGLALAMNTLGPLVTLGPLLLILHYGVIGREERYMDARFGDAYRHYRTQVRRWL